MAVAANAPRLAATRLLSHQLEALAIAIGMVLKEYRDYSGANKQSKKQKDIVKEARTHQATVSNLETGKGIPKNPELRRILKSVGLNPSSKDGSAVLALLGVIRDNRKRIAKLDTHQPE